MEREIVFDRQGADISIELGSSGIVAIYQGGSLCGPPAQMIEFHTLDEFSRFITECSAFYNEIVRRQMGNENND